MSEFQARVLKLVSKVPRGRVATYGEIARALGNPRAYRAVAKALARNPHPIKIPCHRVVKSNGEIGGYRLGSKRKAKLLVEEGVEIRGGKVELEKYSFKF
jgi:methylated-DNA-[protein]-cysteine S-methyltransferase